MISGILNNPITRYAVGIIFSGIIMGLFLLILPTWEVNQSMISSISWAYGKIWSFNFIIPVATLMRCFQIWLILEMTLISTKILFFVVDQITDAK
jgi:hypothetical protein